jgi:hypothetical protein
MSTESSADPQSNPPSHRDRKNRERDKVKDQVPTPQFATTPVGSNPLGEGNWIRSAAALVIGCEQSLGFLELGIVIMLMGCQ